MNTLSIVSYNVNGIRAAIQKGWAEWLIENSFDIVCIQETKAFENQVELDKIKSAGYHVYWFAAQKPGYSGVAIFSKLKADAVEYGCGINPYDTEGRVLRVDFGSLSILNCYFPSGTSGDERQDFKMNFLADFQDWISELKQLRKNLLILGDYNIAQENIDIHNPKVKASGFLPEERQWMRDWFASGFCDAFRYLNPNLAEYSWWSYRMASRAKNKGWRIDYQSYSQHLAPFLLQSRHLSEAAHSDHCPVWVKVKKDILL